MRYSAGTRTKTSDDAVLISTIVVVTILVTITVAALLVHPGAHAAGAGIARTLGEGVTVHGPPAVIRII